MPWGGFGNIFGCLGEIFCAQKGSIKHLGSDLLKSRKTLKFITGYCKIRGPEDINL